MCICTVMQISFLPNDLHLTDFKSCMPMFVNSGCHDESTHNVPSHLGSHCFAMMSYATISGPI